MLTRHRGPSRRMAFRQTAPDPDARPPRQSLRPRAGPGRRRARQGPRRAGTVPARGLAERAPAVGRAAVRPLFSSDRRAGRARRDPGGDLCSSARRLRYDDDGRRRPAGAGRRLGAGRAAGVSTLSIRTRPDLGAASGRRCRVWPDRRLRRNAGVSGGRSRRHGTGRDLGGDGHGRSDRPSLCLAGADRALAAAGRPVAQYCRGRGDPKRPDPDRTGAGATRHERAGRVRRPAGPRPAKRRRRAGSGRRQRPDDPPDHALYRPDRAGHRPPRRASGCAI